MALPALKQKILDCMTAGAENVHRRMDADTGRILSDNGGWALTNQNAVYTLALVCTASESKRRGDADVLRAAYAAGDALKDFQNDDGSWEFVKDDGSRWGKTFMPWPVHHWLEAYRLLKDSMDAERKADWEAGLRLFCTGMKSQLSPDKRIHNIPSWNAMNLVRAGQLFGEDDWVTIGREYLLRVCDAQHPDGFWAEGGCPTTVYNLVYVHALGMYFRFTGDATVKPALQRAVDFHRHFTYPNGSSVETVDGRVRYHDRPMIYGYPGFLAFPDGRRLAMTALDRMASDPDGSLNGTLASAYEYLCDLNANDTTTTPENADTEDLPAVSVYHDHALVRHAEPWMIVLNGYIAPTEELSNRSRSRWLKDMQNLASVWHDRAGLLVGGGNSKHQPAFSTFEVFAGRRRILQPDAVTFNTGSAGDEMVAQYGAVVCRLATAILDDGGIRLTFSVDALPANTDSPVQVTAGLTLPGLNGKSVKAQNEDDADTLCEKREWTFSAFDDDRELQIGDAVFKLPPHARFRWPEYPFNPYAIDNAAPPNQAVGAVAISVTPGGAPISVDIHLRND